MAIGGFFSAIGCPVNLLLKPGGFCKCDCWMTDSGGSVQRLRDFSGNLDSNKLACYDRPYFEQIALNTFDKVFKYREILEVI